MTTVIKVSGVLKCSSEDTEHPSSNLLTPLTKSWRCSRREAATGRATITLELETPGSFVENIDIVNAGAAFIQVDGLCGVDAGPVPLLPMKQLMTQADCTRYRNTSEYTSCHMFTRKDFAENSSRRFRYLLLTVTQPFMLGYPFGIGRVTVRKPTSQQEVKTPKLSDPNKDGEITFSFMKKSGPARDFYGPSQKVKMGGLNDAVADEDFEMKKTSPMSKLGQKEKSNTVTPTRNTYFATINQQHDFIYKTPRATKKTPKTPSSVPEEKEKTRNTEEEPENKENSEATPTRKRKKSKLLFSSSSKGTERKLGSGKDKKSKPKKGATSDEDLPEVSLDCDLDTYLKANISSPEKTLKKRRTYSSSPRISGIELSPGKPSSSKQPPVKTASPTASKWIKCSFPSAKTPKSASKWTDSKKKNKSPFRLKIENIGGPKNKPISVDDDDDSIICDPLPSKELSVLAECPVCGDFFNNDIIQTHANNCLDNI